jgi:hypothetical protein
MDDSPDWAAPVGMLGLLIASLVVTVGTFWAFERGAPDFSVFYGAWRLVLEGRGAEVYHGTTDRFLYAPGFAWLLAPLGLLPRSAALALWCFLKAGIVGYLVREFQPLRRRGLASLGLAAWGTVLVARPLLIDFQYGQVNVVILGICCWALLGHFRRGEGDWGDALRWFVLAIAAVAKLFPLPLLAVPWVVSGPVPRSRLRWERMGLILGVLSILALPAVSVGISGMLELLAQWREALISRGLPFESHNQSFSAWLHRWLSGEPVHVVALGPQSIRMGAAWLSESALHLLSLAWMFVSGGFLVAWLLSGSRRAPLPWIAVMVALLILPSHLVWKPYFVFFLPLAALISGAAFRESARRSDLRTVGLVVAFVCMNLLGFDVLGPKWGARFEAGSSMLWAALIYLSIGLRDLRAYSPQVSE